MGNIETAFLISRTTDEFVEKVKRGGYRPGAGRKAGDRSKVVTIRVSPEALEILNAQANKSEYVDRLIKAEGKHDKLLARITKPGKTIKDLAE